MTLRLTTALMATLAGAPVPAQRTSRLHFGLAVSSMNGPICEETRAGAYAGVSFDVVTTFASASSTSRPKFDGDLGPLAL